MSKLKGHRTITREAVHQLKNECSVHSLADDLDIVQLPRLVQRIDIADVVSGGHWKTDGSAQRHHFMRRSSQSPYEGWEESVEWVRENAMQTSAQLYVQMRKTYGSQKKIRSSNSHRRPDHECRIPTLGPSAGKSLFAAPAHVPHLQPVDWSFLGNALHAVQDSFSRGHVHRSEASGNRPGKIINVLAYEGEEKEGHSEYDKEWWDEQKDDFSTSGKYALEATKNLILLVLDAAVANFRNQNFSGWEQYKEFWLSAGDSLKA